MAGVYGAGASSRTRTKRERDSADLPGESSQREHSSASSAGEGRDPRGAISRERRELEQGLAEAYSDLRANLEWIVEPFSPGSREQGMVSAHYKQIDAIRKRIQALDDQEGRLANLEAHGHQNPARIALERRRTAAYNKVISDLRALRDPRIQNPPDAAEIRRDFEAINEIDDKIGELDGPNSIEVQSSTSPSTSPSLSDIRKRLTRLRSL